MKVLVPCCGRSSRYPNQPPKWMLPGHDGRPMVALALAGLDVSLDDVVVAILREHEEKYRVTEGLQNAFGRPIATVIHEQPTRSQAETVAKTLERMKIDEPFLIKDSDNAFRVRDVQQSDNYVCVESLNNFDSINPRNKSYLQVDHKGQVTNIREKVVISDLFSVGGYYFTQPAQFLAYYARLSSSTTFATRELYISDVIGAMILDGIPFRAQNVDGYEDWGTVHEWKRALLARRTFLVLLDGFVFERGSEHFHPRFDSVTPHKQAIEALQELKKRGDSILYYSIRPQRLADMTARQLEAAGAPAGTVLFGVPIGALSLVAAPHATLPFETVHAFELNPSDDVPVENLVAKLRGEG